MNKKYSSTLTKLVALLNDGQYHDGNTIGESLHITRSAVWKTIQKLQQYDIQVDSVKGRGYALLEPLILLDKNKIKKNLPTKIDLDVLESVGSTNEYLKSKSTKTKQICLAEQQTAGKGRLHRDWYSPFGSNLYISCFYSFEKDMSELAGLSLVTSIAVVKALQNLGIKDNLFVKWPNDILYGNQKLAGNLVEVQAESNGASCAIIGIGLNVNMLKDSRQIPQAWTSMRKISGQYFDRNEVVIVLIQHLLATLEQFNVQGFHPFVDEWMQSDCLTNQKITLHSLDKKVSGQVIGINPQGHLLLRLPTGQVQAFSSGDTSLQKNPSILG